MKKLVLFALAIGILSPAFAAPGHRTPPPPPNHWQAGMMNEDWDARFQRYERKIKHLVRSFKMAKEGSYQANKIKKDLSKEITRLRKDQIEMKKETLREYKANLKDLREGLEVDQRLFNRRRVFLDQRARAIFSRQLKMKRLALNDMKKQIADLEGAIHFASRSSNREKWVQRKMKAAILRNGDMAVFFEGDPLFAPGGMRMSPPPPPPSHGPGMMPPSPHHPGMMPPPPSRGPEAKPGHGPKGPDMKPGKPGKPGKPAPGKPGDKPGKPAPDEKPNPPAAPEAPSAPNPPAAPEAPSAPAANS